MTNASYTFLPWLQRGLAVHTERVDGDSTRGPRAKLPVTVTLGTDQGDRSTSVQLQLIGPGDIKAIDPRIIVRRYPAPGERNAATNYFPAIEFDQPDFPWLLPDPEELALYLEFIEDQFPALAVSAEKSTGLAQLRAALFHLLGLVRVYTRVPGEAANFNSPFVIPRNTTVTELPDRIHHDLGRTFKFARVWGKDTFEGQRVQRDYSLQEGDIIEIHT